MKAHGHTVGKRSPTYNSWRKMRGRILDPKDKRYIHYGGRGIKIHPSWDKFENFLKDMGERPEGMTLDRIDVNGDYGPGNCKWSDIVEQNRNRRVCK